MRQRRSQERADSPGRQPGGGAAKWGDKEASDISQLGGGKINTVRHSAPITHATLSVDLRPKSITPVSPVAANP